MTDGHPAILMDTNLSEDDIGDIKRLIADLRAMIGDHWGFVLDLKDNIAQVLRCIYADTGPVGINPVMNVPLIADLSWRVTAIGRDESTHFERVDMEDPRSFYFRRSTPIHEMVLVPIKADVNIGLLTMFCTEQKRVSLGEPEIKALTKRCQSLTPTLARTVFKTEQELIDEFVLGIRKRETPIFISQIFNRFLEMPVMFLSRATSASDEYSVVYEQGLPSLASDERPILRIPNPDDQRILQVTWSEIGGDVHVLPDMAMSVVFLTEHRENALLIVGEMRLRGNVLENFNYYLNLIEDLLNKPPYQISTLTFLLHLQHWMRHADVDIGQISQNIVDTMVPFLGADFGTLALLDREKNHMLFVSQAGEFRNPLKSLPMIGEPGGEPKSIAAWVVQNNKPFLAQDVSKVSFYRAFASQIRSEMCAPIRVRGDIIGLFSVSSRKINQFDSDDLAKLEFFADQIGVALFQAGILERALSQSEEAQKLDQEIRFGFHRRTHAEDLTYNFGNLIGDPEGAMGSVFRAIRKINGSGRDDLNVLITGETGCGKEMVAFALHNSSSRGKRPMVVANFASFGGDPNLIQSELFGHERGSFSGASHRRIGCIEQANASTLLIDEVGDIVSSVQIKLLRVLQQGAEKHFQRLGGQEDIKSDVRILAATHKDLRQEVASSRFREDLFYRLQTLVIRIPPLRERLQDIPMLSSHFIAKYRRMTPDLDIRFTDSGIAAMQDYHWPGNVRQLEAVINRALVLYAEEGVLDGDAIRESLKAEAAAMPVSVVSLFQQVRNGGEGAFWRELREPFRRHDLTRAQLEETIREALTETRGSYKQAAKMMGVVDSEYHRFLDFLKNSDCKPDYREFR